MLLCALESKVTRCNVVMQTDMFFLSAAKNAFQAAACCTFCGALVLSIVALCIGMPMFVVNYSTRQPKLCP